MSLAKRRAFALVLWLAIAMVFAGCPESPSGPDSGAEPDRTAPSVTATTPQNGAHDVSVDTLVSATFSEAMDPASISGNTFTLASSDGAVVAGTVTYSDKTATFTPADALTYNATFLAKVTAGAKDLAGNPIARDYAWTFKTAPASDTTQPTVTETSPGENAIGVVIDTTITATFSESMDAATIAEGVFVVYDSTSGSISGALSYGGLTATFTPAVPLEYGSTYVAVVSSDAKDLAGNRMAANHLWSFTTEDPPDTTAPEVETASPSPGATQVEVDVPVRVTFSEPVAPDTVTDATFFIQDPSAERVSGSIAYDALTATFTPSEHLAAATTYTVTLTAGIRDLEGNALVEDYAWSFTTTLASEASPPTVQSTSPGPNATGAPIDTVVTATFTEAMDASTITTATFAVYDAATGMVDATVEYEGVTATLRPVEPLEPAVVHALVISGDVADLAGNKMGESYISSFATEDPPDTTPPVVVSTSPARDAAFVPLNTAVNATFSEDMDPVTITSETFFVRDASQNPVAGTITYADGLASFKPTSSLAYASTYTATITTGAADVDGNGLEEDYVWSFSTTPAPENRFLRRSGNKLVVGEKGEAIILRGVHFNTDDLSESTISWPYHHYASDFRRVADLGMNVIRFALNYRTFEDDEQPYTYRAAAWDWLDQNIAWARDNDLYLILVMYQPQGGFQGTEEGLALWDDSLGAQENQNRLTALWRAIAARYVDEPAVAGYDLLNAPMTSASVDQWKTLAQDLVDAIRSVDENHLIIVERCYGVFQQYDTYEDLGLTQFLVGDDNVMYDFHFYYPDEYTRQNIDYLGYGDGGTYPDEGLFILPSDTTWQGGTFLNPPVAEGTTDWTFYEGAYARVDDPEVFAAVPSFSCFQNSGTVYFDDLEVKEYDEGLNYVQTVLSANITSDDGWTSWSADGSGLFGLASAEGHGDTASLYIADSAGYCLWSNRDLRFTIRPEYHYQVNAWMKGVNVPAGASGVALCNFETSPSGQPLLRRNKEYIEHTLLRFLDFGIRNNVPISVGEFGLVQDCFEDGKGGEIWLEDVLDVLDTYGVHWIYYSYHNADFGIHTTMELPEDSTAREELVLAFNGYFPSAKPPDLTPPTVAATTPDTDAADVPIDATITITFDEPMLAATLTPGAFTIAYEDASHAQRTLDADVRFENGTLTIIPSTYASQLDYDTTYTVTVSRDVMDAGANGLASEYSWTFTTAAGDFSAFARRKGREIVIGAGEQPLLLRGIGFGNIVWSMHEFGTGLQYTHHTESSFEEIKEMGMNCIRFYLNYLSLEDDDNPYVYKQEGWDYLDRNVAWAAKHGVYLILNMHIPQGGFQGDPEGQDLWLVRENQLRLKALWKAIAERYKNEPIIIGYGLVNEPIPPNSVDEWVTLAQEIADEIRTVDPRHMLVVERIPAPYERWDIGADPAQTQRLINDDNVLYEFHVYPPPDYAFQLTRYSPDDGGAYPDPDVVATSWLEWAATNGGNPKVPQGDSDWASYEGVLFKCDDTEIVAGLPIFYCENNPGGTVYFDGFTVAEYDESDQFLGNIRDVTVDSDVGWKNQQDEENTQFGVSQTEGHGDSVSLYIQDATGFSQWYHPLLTFPVQTGHSYRVTGWAKGVNVAAGADCGIRIEFQKSSHGDPVFARDIDYLEYEVTKYQQFGIDNNVPMYVGEFGASLACYSHNKGGLFWVSDMLTALDRAAIHFTFHAYNDKCFGIYWTEGALPDPDLANNDLIDLFKTFFGVEK